MDPLLVLLGIATFLVAGLVKGTLGLGLPTVAIGLLSLVVPPATAAAVLMAPSLVTNVWQALAGPAIRPLLVRLGPMLGASAAGTLLGAWLFGAPGPAAVPLLGAALILYALLGFFRLPLVVRPETEPWLGPLAGLATGLVTAATGVFVIPAVPYLAALGLSRDALVQSLGLSFTVSTAALGVGLLGARVLDLWLVGVSVAALLPTFAGVVAGQWLRGRVSAETFRLGFLVGLLLLGAHLALARLL